MKILLVGSLGKMGKEITNAVAETGDKIVLGIDTKDEKNGSFKTFHALPKKLPSFDVIIDFSTAKSRKELFNLAKERKVPYGLFSTVISNEDEKELCELSKFVPVLQTKNTSLGINLLYEILKVICPKLTHADAVVTEYHHKQKLDSPSGTAKEIEKILEAEEINFNTCAFRVGNEKGYHKVQFFFGDEILEIAHRANSRKIFAAGAINAMHKLSSKPAGLYNNILEL